MDQLTHDRKRIVILGGGFGGVYTAMYLESLFKGRDEVEIALVNKDNYFVFQPMLPEVISGSIGLLDTVSPIHRLLPRTRLYIRDVESVDLVKQTVTLAPAFWPQSVILKYDQLVLALGTVTDFRGMPGLPEHALPFKNMADALHLRNHLIHVVEEACIETDEALRRQLLTFVVGGGGFSGVEVAAELNDYVRHLAKKRKLDGSLVRVLLVHSGVQILDRELDPRLSRYAQRILERRGVEFRMKCRLVSATPDAANLENGERIPTKTLISTVPSSPNPIVDSLPLRKQGGKIEVDPHFRSVDSEHIWAVGDCVSYQYPDGSGFCPPTAQHAIRQAKVVAENIAASFNGGKMRTLTFTGLGKMGSLGHRCAVAELFGRIRISGFFAWIMWRTIYWWKLPGFDRKLRVGLSWLLDLLVPLETVQLKLVQSQGVCEVHFEPDETIIRQGELGDTMYIILRGEVEVIVERDGTEPIHRRLKSPAYFGEMALLNNRVRTGTVRAVTATDLIALQRREFNLLIANLPVLRENIETESKKRREDAVVR
jgi:NADH dehydrogenase